MQLIKYLHTHTHTHTHTQLRSHGLLPIHAHRTGGVTGSKRQEGLNGVGSGIGVGDGNRDGEGVGRGKGVEVNDGAQDGNGDGSGERWGRGPGHGWRALDEHRMETGTGVRTETRAITEMGI